MKILMYFAKIVSFLVYSRNKLSSGSDKIAIHNVPFLHMFEYWADPAFLGLLLNLGKSGYVFICQL